MPIYSATFSDRSAYQLQLHIVPRAYNLAGNYTDVDWGLYIVETWDYGSWSYDPASWSVTVDGQTWSGATPYDFRGSGAQTLRVGGGTKRVTHDGNGYRSISFSSAVGGRTTIGSATAKGSLALTRIPKTPGAPLITGTVGNTVLGPQDIKTTSILCKFSGTTDGGSTITGWQLQVATNTAFTTDVVTLSSGGSTTVTGLKPGVMYYFRARGGNNVGWGAWSATASAKTRAALYVSDGTAWQSVEIYVSDGTTWHIAEVYVSNGSAWLEPAAA